MAAGSPGCTAGCRLFLLLQIRALLRRTYSRLCLARLSCRLGHGGLPPALGAPPVLIAQPGGQHRPDFLLPPHDVAPPALALGLGLSTKPVILCVPVTDLHYRYLPPRRRAGI